MGKQVKIEGFVYEVDYGFGEPHYSLCSSDGNSHKYMSLVGPAEFTYTIPDDYDPRISKLAALDEKERMLRANFAKSMMELADDRAKLLCIESAVTE